MKSPTVETSRWVGRVLRDKWRIDARIARGGVGTVFAATHKNNGNRVAIKVLHPEFSRDQDTKSRFLQEGYAANQVNHPGVVRILDDDTTEEGAAFLVMELLEGEPLEKRRVRMGGKLPLGEVYELADQLLDVLATAHEKGIVHRDIKPENLFVTTDGRLKVLDFGFAQMKTGVRREQTATGYLLGTPGFMSPEQSVGNRAQVDAQTDIWAVGATLFYLISGHPVHEGESAAEMLVAAANYKARSLATVAAGLPPKLVMIVDKALAFDKADRWPSARAMQSALRSVPGRPAPQGAPDPRRRSVPDSAPISDERTMFDPVHKVEELDSEDLIEAQPSWITSDRTVMAGPNRPMPAAALPSRPPSALAAHPADQDVATLARPTPFGDFPPPTASPVTPILRSPSMPPSGPEGTVIMDSSPAAPGNAGRSGDYPAMEPVPMTAPMAGGHFGRGSFPAITPTPQAFVTGRLSQPEIQAGGDLMFVAGPARPAEPRRGGTRVLVFVGVALLSMIIVVVTGLLIFAATD